jgi:hypothetical protein
MSAVGQPVRLRECGLAAAVDAHDAGEALRRKRVDLVRKRRHAAYAIAERHLPTTRLVPLVAVASTRDGYKSGLTVPTKSGTPVES